MLLSCRQRVLSDTCVPLRAREARLLAMKTCLASLTEATVGDVSAPWSMTDVLVVMRTCLVMHNRRMVVHVDASVGEMSSSTSELAPRSRVTLCFVHGVDASIAATSGAVVLVDALERETAEGIGARHSPSRRGSRPT